jgi:hypothetical protein
MSQSILKYFVLDFLYILYGTNKAKNKSRKTDFKCTSCRTFAKGQRFFLVQTHQLQVIETYARGFPTIS